MNTPGTPVTSTVGLLGNILLIIEIANDAALGIPATSPFAAIAAKFIAIADAAIQAHEQLTGQPFDASKIPAITPIP